MTALFFLVCLTGEPECFNATGDIYPDIQNCEADMKERGLGKLHVCLPVEVRRLENNDAKFW